MRSQAVAGKNLELFRIAKKNIKNILTLFEHTQFMKFRSQSIFDIMQDKSEQVLNLIGISRKSDHY